MSKTSYYALVLGMTTAVACGDSSTSRRTAQQDAGDASSADREQTGQSEPDLADAGPDGGSERDASPEGVPADGGAGDAGSENTPPTVVDLEFETHEDTAIEVTLTGADPDDDTLSFDVEEPAHGTLSRDGNIIRYQPDPDFNGDDVFEYTASDGTDDSGVGTVTIQVLPVNDAPAAGDDVYSVDEGQSLFSNSGVLANDVDVDEDELTVSEELVVEPLFGILSLSADGTFSYTHTAENHPAENNAEDTFTYEVCDPEGACDRGTVVLSIALENDPPWTEDDVFTVSQGGSLSVDVPGVAANDGDVDDDELHVQLVTEPTAGNLTLNADGSFDYDHDGASTAEDSFVYELCDPDDACTTATVVLLVVEGPSNNPPLAITDSYVVEQGGTLLASPSILANDSDPDGAITLSDAPLTLPEYGTLTLNGDGSFTYVHDGSETVSDAFTYEICDAEGLCNVGLVSITVTDVNQAPVASDDEVSVDEGAAVSHNVLDNDDDQDGDLLSATLLSPPAHGSLSLGDNGDMSYVHDGNESSEDSFEYEACDSDAQCDSAVVHITIAPVNDPPQARDDAYAGGEGMAYNSRTSLLANDVDPDDDELRVLTTPVVPPQSGTLALQSDGQFTFTPNEPERRISWSYQVCDPSEACAEATAVLDFRNLPPFAVSDSAVSCLGQSVVIPVLSNDSDPGDDPIELGEILSQPSFGSASIARGQVVYQGVSLDAAGAPIVTPELVSFEYEVCDDEGACSAGLVTVEIVYDAKDPRCL